MGQLIDGRWEAGDANPKTSDGAFERKESVFRNWVTADGAPGPTGAGGFAAESGRYHLYVSYACPWAHRALIYRAVKGLAAHITVDVVHPFMLDDGWTFDTGFPGTTGDTLLGKRFLREVYLEPTRRRRPRSPCPSSGTVRPGPSSRTSRPRSSACSARPSTASPATPSTSVPRRLPTRSTASTPASTAASTTASTAPASRAPRPPTTPPPRRSSRRSTGSRRTSPTAAS